MKKVTEGITAIQDNALDMIAKQLGTEDEDRIKLEMIAEILTQCKIQRERYKGKIVRENFNKKQKATSAQN